MKDIFENRLIDLKSKKINGKKYSQILYDNIKYFNENDFCMITFKKYANEFNSLDMNISNESQRLKNLIKEIIRFYEKQVFRSEKIFDSFKNTLLDYTLDNKEKLVGLIDFLEFFKKLEDLNNRQQNQIESEIYYDINAKISTMNNKLKFLNQSNIKNKEELRDNEKQIKKLNEKTSKIKGRLTNIENNSESKNELDVNEINLKKEIDDFSARIDYINEELKNSTIKEQNKNNYHKEVLIFSDLDKEVMDKIQIKNNFESNNIFEIYQQTFILQFWKSNKMKINEKKLDSLLSSNEISKFIFILSKHHEIEIELKIDDLIEKLAGKKKAYKILLISHPNNYKFNKRIYDLHNQDLLIKLCSELSLIEEFIEEHLRFFMMNEYNDSSNSKNSERAILDEEKMNLEKKIKQNIEYLQEKYIFDQDYIKKKNIAIEEMKLEIFQEEKITEMEMNKYIDLNQILQENINQNEKEIFELNQTLKILLLQKKDLDKDPNNQRKRIANLSKFNNIEETNCIKVYIELLIERKCKLVEMLNRLENIIKNNNMNDYQKNYQEEKYFFIQFQEFINLNFVFSHY